jgi:putative transposase
VLHAGRLDAPEVLRHIMIRGIERRNIFRDDTDREEFLARPARLLPETETACYAWALLPNHVHLFLRTRAAPLPTLMRRLLTGYAVPFNRRHGPTAHDTGAAARLEPAGGCATPFSEARPWSGKSILNY